MTLQVFLDRACYKAGALVQTNSISIAYSDIFSFQSQIDNIHRNFRRDTRYEAEVPVAIPSLITISLFSNPPPLLPMEQCQPVSPDARPNEGHVRSYVRCVRGPRVLIYSIHTRRMLRHGMQVIISRFPLNESLDQERAVTRKEKRDERAQDPPLSYRTLDTRWLGSGPLPSWINCHAKTHDG